MNRYQAVKMYQAISESICITEFGPELLPGWFATSKEALASFRSEPVAETATNVAEIATPKKRGRPKKES